MQSWQLDNGQWTTPSDLFPLWSKSEDDVEELTE